MWSNDLTKFFKIARYTCLPLTEKVKQDHLARVRDRIAFYKPKIEEKTGANLGTINIGEYRERTREGRKKASREFNNIVKKIPLLYRPAGYGINYSILLPLRYLHDMFREDNIMLHYSPKLPMVPPTIYVTFGLNCRIFMIEKILGHPNLDHVVMHELSHCLWDVLERENGSCITDCFDNKEVWKEKESLIEGHACYCAYEYFSDFYPDSYKPGVIYSRDKQKLDELVRRYGQDIILEIPKRWQEFNEELKKSKLLKTA